MAQIQEERQHDRAVEPLPENIRSAQPGEGFGYRVEMAWGRWRRWYLRHFRPAYVRRMAQRRVGDPSGCPHEVLDPRDLKFFRIRCDCHWKPEDDPFGWRERLPWARWGLAELQLFGWPLAALTAVAVWAFWPLAIVPATALGLVLYFFRDPQRAIPTEAGLVVAPADGRVVSIDRLDHCDEVGGPAVRIGIFLSIFNVHLNRAPTDARVLWLRYEPGKFLNALRPESARENESMWIGLEELHEAAPTGRRYVVRQISGAIARRIVCDLKPGQVVRRGERFGMIKLGSRTELTLPDDGTLELAVALGDRLKAGASVVARYGVQSEPHGTTATVGVG